MFDLGIEELILIFIVALIVFGPKRLPELGKALGKGMLELRKAMEGVREQIHAESDMTLPHEEGVPGLEEKKKELNVESDSSHSTTEAYPKIEEKKDEKVLAQRPPEAEEITETNKKVPEERKEDMVDGR